MNFSHFLMEVSFNWYANKDHRFGQCCFNVLAVLEPDLAETLRGGRIDPFYDDDRVPEFLAKVRDHFE